MHSKFQLWLVGLLAFSPGCSLVRDATSLTIFKVRESTWDIREGIRNRKWAEQAWEEMSSANTKTPYSEDYASGFKEGFAQFLFRGGNGEPPPLPPRHYRKLSYQTPQGYQAIEDWFAGFRCGAEMARESGRREWITGPSALRSAAVVQPPVDPRPIEPVHEPLPSVTLVQPPVDPRRTEPVPSVTLTPLPSPVPRPGANNERPSTLPPAAALRQKPIQIN